LLVPRALIDRGIGHVLAPLRTRSSGLWCPLGDDDSTVVLYPFVRGKNAKAAGLSDDQWREFGSTLRAVHESGLGERFRGQLRAETFTLPSAAVARRLLADLDGATFASPAAARFAAFWLDNAARIRGLLARAEELGARLRAKTFDHVLCHADIHGANVLVGEDSRIWLVDWDGPLLAPRERDLLFVVGSRIGRPVAPEEEDWFFDGYGPAEVDPVALAYYRYERRIEDLGEIGERVFLDPTLGEPARGVAAEAAMGLFAPGGDLDVAETVPRRQWPSAGG
jgi:spectinomycin phosphotransferase